MVIYQIDSRKKRNFLSRLSFTTQLIILNVGLFFIFSLLIGLKVISIDFVAINPANILNGLYLWTFVTSMFMHGGFFHLFVNMLSLYFIGNLIERILGKQRYLSFYLISGIISSLAFVLIAYFFGMDLNTYAVGASGALFGLVGVLVLLTPDLPVYMMFIPIPIKMKYAAPGLLVILWLISITADIPIGNVAHFGGLVAGLVYGFYIRKKFPNKIKLISQRFS
jgi:uncharacterized protein